MSDGDDISCTINMVYYIYMMMIMMMEVDSVRIPLLVDECVCISTRVSNEGKQHGMMIPITAYTYCC